MTKTVLVVEDEFVTRNCYRVALETAGWTMTEAHDGEAALMALRKGLKPDAIVLDLRLPDLSGVEVLRRAEEEHLPLPAVIVISGVLDNEALRQLANQRVQAIIAKPVDLELLARIVQSVVDGSALALNELRAAAEGRQLELQIGDHPGGRMYGFLRPADIESRRTWLEAEAEWLSAEAHQREQALTGYLKSCSLAPVAWAATEPLLLVGRRWNSWYPGFFAVRGGAYAIVGARAVDGTAPAALIDPGFRALEGLRELGLPVGSLEHCLLTHNHPDHIASVFEYLCLRHALGRPSVLHCAESVRANLETLAGPGTGVIGFKGDPIELFDAYDCPDGARRIHVSPFPTSHVDGGQLGETIGLMLSSRRGPNKERPDSVVGMAALLGDTDYFPDEGGGRSESILHLLAHPRLRVAVVHIGSAQLKQKAGKHLYLSGLKALLQHLDVERQLHVPDAREKPLLVLVSEWGLEHATAEQIAAGAPGAADLAAAFSRESLIEKTIYLLQDMLPLETITLLPADFGLWVGIDTGRIYLDGIRPVPPESVRFEVAGPGLKYSIAAEAAGA